MITNIFIEYPEIDFENPDFSKVENVENEIRREIEGLAEGIKNTDANVILVTNELGCGIVPENLFTRVFRDISGRVNQYIAYFCDEVYVTICGLPLKLK
jgi:adenosylcobinamide kinase/adenosylcobinamide-phosphate guanylyltransferase